MKCCFACLELFCSHQGMFPLSRGTGRRTFWQNKKTLSCLYLDRRNVNITVGHEFLSSKTYFEPPFRMELADCFLYISR